MIAEGPRKGEPSTRIMRNGFRTQPAPLVRGSSRRIMSMRFRPANISVINRRDSAEAVISPAVQKEPRGTKPTVSFPLGIPILPSTAKLKAHQQEHVPAKPPVESLANARMVLAVKGSLCRATLRRALDGSAPFRPSAYRDGRLRREHAMPVRKARKIKTWSLKLDKAAPYQFADGFSARSMTRISTGPLAA
jgi:hypothetical protein